MMEEAKKESLFLKYFRDFSVLLETRSEYWGIQVINFWDSAFYFAMLMVVSIFLSNDLGMEDKTAGYVIAVFTSSTTLLLLFSGAVTDWLGIRKSLLGSLGVLTVLRALVVVVGLNESLPHRGWVVAVLLTLMAPFTASISSVYQSATARFTTKRSRSAGFNLWYLFMNIGAASAGALVDFFRLQLKLEKACTHIFTFGVVVSILSMVVVVMMVRNEQQLVGSEEEEEAVEVVRKSPGRGLVEMFQHSAMWKLISLIGLILGVRAVFSYLYLLMPKYWVRTIGEDVAMGTLNMINPIGIVFGLILFIPLAGRYPTFKMLIYGAIVSSLALFPMAVPWTQYGLGIEATHYVMAVLAMVLVTIGEVVWSPKLNEYTASIAPKGQEGAYLGMSMVPWFLAKTTVSLLSGHMLARWVPETVELATGDKVSLKQAMQMGALDYWHRPECMWLVLGAVALAGCLGAWMLRGWFEGGVEERKLVKGGDSDTLGSEG